MHCQYLTFNIANGFKFYITMERTGRALCSGNRWYFFSQIEDKRVTGNGYWKQLDFEEPVINSAGKKIGMKKYFVFCVGEAPLGVETNWIMQEYHLCSCGASANKSYKRRGNRILVSEVHVSL